MKKKKIFLLIIILFILVVGGLFVYYTMTKKDKTTSLTIVEKKWVEEIKKENIDLEIANNLPIFSYDGQGLFFNFLDDLNKDVGISFNKIPYDEEEKNNYTFKLVTDISDNQIVIYEDNYAIISKNKTKYNNLNDISNMKVGVLTDDVENVKKYLNEGIEFETYENDDALFKSIVDSAEENYVIIAPKTMYLKEILKNNLYVSYNITEMVKYYVLELGDNKKLNTILNKYYDTWYSNNYTDLYNKYLLTIYLSFSEIDEKTKTQFKSKSYTYGYVENIPFDGVISGKEVGINIHLIKEFSTFAGIDIEYKKYGKVKDMVKGFKDEKIDFMFNYTDSKLENIYNTVSIYDENIVVLSKLDNNNVINSIYSLNNKNVSTIKSSKIETLLKSKDVKTKSYNSINSMLKKASNDSILVIDMYTYNYYKNNKLADYKIDYQFYLDNDYNYVINDTDENKIFIEAFDFYLSFMNEKSIVNSEFNLLLNVKDNNWILLLIIPFLLAIYGTYVLVNNIIKLFGKVVKKEDNLTKEDKLRYIDMLTSLKNRSYLNDHIEKWDDSEVYPQSIIIVDLNNIAYVNDNYGHEEGDKLIREAANILIRNQIINSEIIRSDGNEFLLYLVGYDEKQIVSYIRKLNKEFKELTHGFGVAIGYSMILDAIKTIDDAVNEATLDMRSNKEENNN